MSDTMKRMWTERQVRALGVDAVEQKSDLKVFENIVDKDGHKRFIEGDITPQEISGITFTYAKWSLSGTHLMVVLAGNVANTTTLTAGTSLARNISVPSWVLDKIVATFSTVIEVKTLTMYASGWGSQSLTATIRKSSSAGLSVANESNLTLTDDRSFRIQFDLLVDNE